MQPFMEPRAGSDPGDHLLWHLLCTGKLRPGDKWGLPRPQSQKVAEPVSRSSARLSLPPSPGHVRARSISHHQRIPVHPLLTPALRGWYWYASRVTDEQAQSPRRYLIRLSPGQWVSSAAEATTSTAIITTSIAHGGAFSRLALGRGPQTYYPIEEFLLTFSTWLKHGGYTYFFHFY